MDAPDTQVLNAMLSPALFMTATGSLLLSANNRLARVVDRLRVLTDSGDGIVRGATSLNRPEERLHHIRGMIRLQQKRANIILTTVTLLYGAFGAFVGTSLGIAVNVLTNRIPPAIPIEHRKRMEKNLHRRAKELGYELRKVETPAEAEPQPS